MSYTEPTGTTLNIELKGYNYIQPTGTILDIELSVKGDFIPQIIMS